MSELDGDKGLALTPHSYWLDSPHQPSFDQLSQDAKTDVVIVGGGITGITAAYLLVLSGVKVTVLEADRVGHGTTGHTTAKVTAQHGVIYDEFIQHMGLDKAKLYYDANQQAIEFIRATAYEQNIACDFEEQDAYIFTGTEDGARQLEREYAAYKAIGINGDFLDDIPIPLKVRKALVMRNQAQFHPLLYVAGLLRTIADKGGAVFENTVAVDLEETPSPTVITRSGHRVTGSKVLICSHFPFHGAGGFYFSRMSANRAYVVAVKAKGDYPGGMYINVEEPTRSLRSVVFNNERLVLAIGENHKAGQGGDALSHYEALESFAQSVFGSVEVRYRWSAQDLSTLDKVPYIGNITSNHPNVLVATGFRKWGMTTGIVAAQLLTDAVLGKANPYASLYAPDRFYADPSIKTFLRENANVAGHLLKGKLEAPLRHAEGLSRGEGAVIFHDGQRAGGYRDEAGTVRVVDTTCTHLGCEVVWNGEDRTWDCPCHGSRFLTDGSVMEGPAKQPLRRLD